MTDFKCEKCLQDKPDVRPGEDEEWLCQDCRDGVITLAERGHKYAALRGMPRDWIPKTIPVTRSTVALKVAGVWWNEKAGEKYLQDSVDKQGNTP